MKKIILWIITFFIFISISFAWNNSEVEKLQWHFERLDWILRAVDTSNLTTTQKENRIKNLDLLKKYSLEWNFPNNDKFPWEYVPFFKWSNWNLCAVWYLMNNNPEYKDFVKNISETNNNIKVMDIKNNKIFDSWLQKNGFTKLEAAIIQPTYSPCMRWECNPACIENCSKEEINLHHNEMTIKKVILYYIKFIFWFIIIIFIPIFFLLWLYFYFIINKSETINKESKKNKEKWKKYIKIALFLSIALMFIYYIIKYYVSYLSINY